MQSVLGSIQTFYDGELLFFTLMLFCLMNNNTVGISRKELKQWCLLRQHNIDKAIL